MFGKWQERRVLITVRTYPVPAIKGAEVSCNAGITDKGEWIRLFPVPYRRMGQEHKFKKYDWINVRVKKAGDPRPESFNPDIDSFEVVSFVSPERGTWKARKEIVLPLKAHCLCCLSAQRDAHGSPTLGIFKPKVIKRLIIQRDRDDWTPEERAKMMQRPNLWNQGQPLIELEKIPFKFSYQFSCEEEGCIGHTFSCTDWEMAQGYRHFRQRYGSDWETKFRQKFETEMIERLDTHFFVGTISSHPNRWIIVGLFYPML